MLTASVGVIVGEAVTVGEAVGREVGSDVTVAGSSSVRGACDGLFAVALAVAAADGVIETTGVARGLPVTSDVFLVAASASNSARPGIA